MRSFSWIRRRIHPGRRAGADSDKLRRILERDERVVKVEAVRSPLRKEVTLLTVWLKGNDASDVVMRWVRDLDVKLTPLNVSIGGEAKYRQEVHDEIFNRIKFVLIFVGVSNFVVLAWAFRSLVIPVKAIAMNGLSIGASYGILAWLFPTGRWGLEPTEIAIMIPVFIFGLAFGISMDYGIFLLSRIYESYRRTGDNDRAIREGLSSSSRIITSAAAIMIAVTLPFALADVSGVKQLGIGIAGALFIDATVIRLILVPSMMKLLGRWNWWMPFSGRIFPH